METTKAKKIKPSCHTLPRYPHVKAEAAAHTVDPLFNARSQKNEAASTSECIDCGVCEPECPAEAILPDTENGLEQWLELNTKYSAEWPNLTSKKDAAPDADDFKDALADSCHAKPFITFEKTFG